MKKITRSTKPSIKQLVYDAIVKGDLLKVRKYLSSTSYKAFDDKSKGLHIAAANGHLNIVKLLIKEGADIHSMEEYALRQAAKFGHLDIVKYLVAEGADFDIRKSEPFRLARFNRHKRVTDYLRDLYMNVTI